MPQDVEVIYKYASDWSVLDADEIELHKPEDKRIIFREANGYSTYYPTWKHKDMVPEFRTVVCFPGN